MVVHPSLQLLSSLSYILNATTPTCNQIDNACSVTSQCLSTQHLVRLTAYRTGEAISVVEGGACEAPHDCFSFHYHLCLRMHESASSHRQYIGQSN